MDLLWTGWSRIESILQKTGVEEAIRRTESIVSQLQRIMRRAMNQKWFIARRPMDYF